MKYFIGYQNQSSDDIVIVSPDVKAVIVSLKNKMGSEWEYCYVDVWENNTENIERIPLDEFEKKYLTIYKVK